jgi:hypothetical protein
MMHGNTKLKFYVCYVGAVTSDKTISNNEIISHLLIERKTKEAYVADMSIRNIPKYTDKCTQ